VPQRAQNPRVTGQLDRNSAGAPCVKRNASRATLNQASAGAPDTRRQSAQWHKVRWKMSPSAA
jgi:hypothetical protein